MTAIYLEPYPVDSYSIRLARRNDSLHHATPPLAELGFEKTNLSELNRMKRKMNNTVAQNKKTRRSGFFVFLQAHSGNWHILLDKACDQSEQSLLLVRLAEILVDA
jgi:hypothetical protein